MGCRIKRGLCTFRSGIQTVDYILQKWSAADYDAVKACLPYVERKEGEEREKRHCTVDAGFKSAVYWWCT